MAVRAVNENLLGRLSQDLSRLPGAAPLSAGHRTSDIEYRPSDFGHRPSTIDS
jgi:hypothetical protein